MFAFAIWDQNARRLFLARDGFGQKPLYHAETPAGFFFASEPKALLALPEFPRSLDLFAMSDYMSLRSIPGTRSLLEGVHKLPAATHGMWSNGAWETQRYWRLSYGSKHSGSESAIVRDLNDVFLGAVEC